MTHESDGAMIPVWTHRLVFCRHCQFRYEQIARGDMDCPKCHAKESYYVVETYYNEIRKGIADATDGREPRNR